MPLRPQLPKGANTASTSQILQLADYLSCQRSVAVITGAGISTECGLSDYRSPGKRTPTRPPINHQEYVSSSSIRKLYWARSFVGYPLLSGAKPGLCHYAFASLHDRLGSKFRSHITQNVDGLLQLARTPSKSIIELHGSIHHLICLSCKETENRTDFQTRLVQANSQWSKLLNQHYEYRPDGDADLDGDMVQRFHVPNCHSCGKDALMPAVVFHGGGVPKHISDSATRVVHHAHSLLIVGSSLSTYSAYRLVKMAKMQGKFVALVNYGPSRADDIVDMKIEALVGDSMARLADKLLVGGFKPPDDINMTTIFEMDRLRQQEIERQESNGMLQL